MKTSDDRKAEDSKSVSTRRRFLTSTAGVAGLGLVAGCTGGGAGGGQSDQSTTTASSATATGSGGNGTDSDEPLNVGVFGGIFE